MLNENWYTITFHVLHNATEIMIELTQATYSFNRNPDPNYSNPADFYFSGYVKKFTKEFLQLMADNASYDGYVLITDNEKKTNRKISLNGIFFATFGEGFSNYKSEDGTGNLVLYAKELVIEDVPFTK